MFQSVDEATTVLGAAVRSLFFYKGNAERFNHQISDWPHQQVIRGGWNVPKTWGEVIQSKMWIRGEV